MMKAYIHSALRHSLVVLSVLLLIGTTASAQRGSRTSSRTRVNTSKLMETKSIDIIYISPAMLQSVPRASLKIDGSNAMAGIMDGISSIHIYSSSDQKAIQELRKTFAPIIELRGADLEQLMYVKNNQGIIHLIGQLQGDIASELYMIVSDEEEYTVINFSGSFPRRDIEEAIRQDNRRHKR